MNVPEYARRRGVSRQAVAKAIASGRLTKSVTRDERGRPEILDPGLADREWAGNTSPLRTPAYRKLWRPDPAAAPALPADVAEVTRRLTAIVVDDLAELQRIVLGYVAPFIEGAIEALRSRAGRDPTATELAEALRLEDPDDEDAGIDSCVALHELAEAGPSDPLVVARRAALTVVLGTKEEAHGSEG